MSLIEILMEIAGALFTVLLFRLFVIRRNRRRARIFETSSYSLLAALRRRRP